MTTTTTPVSTASGAAYAIETASVALAAVGELTEDRRDALALAVNILRCRGAHDRSTVFQTRDEALVVMDDLVEYVWDLYGTDIPVGQIIRRALCV